MQSLSATIAGASDRERAAVVGLDGVLGYGDLLVRAHALASRLGVRRSPVALYGHKQPALVVGMVAALRVGRPYVPIDVSAPAGRIARMLDLAGPEDVLLAQQPPPAVARELERRRIDVLAVDPLASGLATADAPPVAVDPPGVDSEAPAYILFTSGTSGDPKGVPIPHRALSHFARWLLASHEFVPSGETFLNQAPFSFDLSVMDVYGALLTGGTLLAIAREEIADPPRLFRRLDGAALTVWVSTPSFARFCLAERRFGEAMLPALRRFLFCGETLPVPVARELLARFPRAQVWNMYGPTETTVAVTAVRVTPAMAAADRPLPVGHPAPGMDVWIGDPDDPGRRLPAGQRGEIVIAGPQVSTGYLQGGSFGGSARESSAFFTLADGRRAYRSGDLGSIDEGDGSLACLGRLDSQIKLHGYRIELEEVEAHLRATPGVADAAVVPIERDGRPDHLVALVVAKATGDPVLPVDGRPLTQQVRSELADALPDYALPRLVRRVPALPLTANGKLDRRALREMLE